MNTRKQKHSTMKFEAKLFFITLAMVVLSSCGGGSGSGSGSGSDSTALVVSTGGNSSTTTPVTQPRGTFSSASATNSNIVNHTQVKGALVRVPWSTIEPTPGNFDFSTIDSQIVSLKAANKGWSLGVVAGPSAPTWLYSSPYNVAPLYITFRGQSVSVPKFWDTTLQQRLTSLAQALGQKYNSDSSLKLVYLPQMSANGIEGHFNGNTDSNLISQGLTEDLWASSVLNGARSFGQAFPQKPIGVELHYILSSANAGIRIMQGITNDVALNGHVGVALWWLSGKTTYQPDLLTAFETFSGAVYAQLIDQSSNASAFASTSSFPNGDYSSAFTQAKSLHIKYVEPWDVDFTSHSWDSLFQDFNTYSAN